MDHVAQLISKIESNSVTVGIIGLDIDIALIEAINSGKSMIEHISSSAVKYAVSESLLMATSDYSMMSQCDAIIMCVPTPLNKYREPDLSYINSTISSLIPHLVKGQILSLESTTYPGTTEEEIVKTLEDANFKIGEDFFVVYSPEREDPGNLSFNTATIPKIVGGHTKNCTKIGILLYEKAINKVIKVSSTQVAEMTKLLENIHRAVNIGLVNEMKIVADKMNIDIFEVIDAAATKPFGFTPYYPGPGLGGHCIPIDPFYLTWKAREFGLHTRFIELSGEINESMPEYVVNKIVDGLNNLGKPLSRSKILVLGIAYKKNVGDMRESPSVKIIDLLIKKGAITSYSDPHVPVFPKMRDYFFELESIKLSSTSLKTFDAVVLATDHDAFDYDLIMKNSSLIIDSRGKFRDYMSQKVIQA
jgi:UDP-N-acetyl-D-glucosamine dehydrogenase